MKTTQILAAALFATGIFTVNAQTNLATSTITSRGLNAGTLGANNAFFGYKAGEVNTTGGLRNTFLGQNAGYLNTSGDDNIAIGHLAGLYNSTGSNNIFIGNQTGCGDRGSVSGSIFIGKWAAACTDNTLIIDNIGDVNPLILGDFASNLLKFNAKVGIGYGFGNYPTTAGSVNVSAYKLFVDGGILAKEVRVATTWADYVFEDGYKLHTLPEVEQYINENGHLPNVPSAKQIEEDGIEVGEMAKIQQEKIEELTLYAIEQQKQLEKQQKEIDELKAIVLKISENK